MESNEEKRIRFIDSEYNLLFTIADGENIKLTYPNGFHAIRKCTFLDEYHTQIGTTCFHIGEFAERMEKAKTQYLPEKPMELPDRCYATHPSSGDLIVLVKNEPGYHLCGFNTENPLYNARQAKQLNEQKLISPRQRAAMEAGSLFGWDTPAADPNRYDAHGVPLPPLDPSQEISFAIYQLKESPQTGDLLYMRLSSLENGIQSVDVNNYRQVYADTIFPLEKMPSDQRMLDELFIQFNTNLPNDFHGHSLSVSDVVVLRRNDAQSAFYVDSYGFAELPEFHVPELNREESSEKHMPRTDQEKSRAAPDMNEMER